MKSLFFFAFIGSSSLVFAQTSLPFRSSNYTSYAKVQASKDVSSIFNNDPIEAARELISLVVPHTTYELADDSYSSSDNVTHLYFKQTMSVGGSLLEAQDCDFNVNVKDGKIFSYGDTFQRSENSTLASSSQVAKRDSLDPLPALKRAIETHGLNISMDGLQVQPAENGGPFVFEGAEGVVRPPSAQIVVHAKQDGGWAPAWKVETWDRYSFLATFMDVDTLEILDVTDYTSHLTATFNVFPWGVQDPTKGEREIVTDPWHPDASPSTWIDPRYDYYPHWMTWGNNARVSHFYYSAASPNATFDFPFALDASHQDNQKACFTQVFYTVSRYHDLLYLLGFNEQAGNFQKDNYDKGGKGEDPIQIMVQLDTSGDEAFYNDAYFAAGPDGVMGLITLHLFNYTMPTRDSGFAADMILHEYTHGLSKRLVGGPGKIGCLAKTLESLSMGEGLSDFMAAAVLTKPTDDRSKDFYFAAWPLGNDTGARIRPYSTDVSVNELRYEDTTETKDFHAFGVVWGVALYDMMWNLIEKHPMTNKEWPELDARGVPTDGRYLTMKLVIGSLSLLTCSPSMVDGRDAILDADIALTGGENQCEIWTAFAKRGLGQGAKHTGFRNEGDDKMPPNVFSQ